MKITNKNLEYLVEELNREGAHLLEGDEWTDRNPEWKSDYARFPKFILQIGSKTYGHAFRIHCTGGTRYQTGWGEPRYFDSYLGMTKADAYQALRFLVAGIRAGKAVQK
jgi:hypothetical protein